MTSRRSSLVFLSLLMLLPACSRTPGPAELDTSGAEMCAFCRMVISDRHLAAQLVARGEEPRFFDDIGCLRDYLASGAAPNGAVSYVADHRTGAWVLASRAVYTRAPSVPTPMDSHLLAHADEASRKADPSAAQAVSLSYEQVFGQPVDGDVR